MGISTEQYRAAIGRWNITKMRSISEPSDSTVLEYPGHNFGDDGLVLKGPWKQHAALLSVIIIILGLMQPCPITSQGNGPTQLSPLTTMSQTTAATITTLNNTEPIAVIDGVGTDGMLSHQCLAALLLMSGVEPNPGPLNDKEHNTDSWIQTQEDILADLCANAPTAEVRDCMRLYNPKNTNKQHKAEFNKCNKPVLVSTLEYLKVPGQDAFTKPACINTVICRIQNLLPDICNICHEEYCVKLSEKSLLTCEICGQGSHNECILHKMNVSEEDIDTFGPQEAAARLNPTGLPGVHYLCGACESSTIPDKEAGMLKRKSTVQNETRDDSQQTQRTEDEEPEEESTTSTEDHSQLQQQETQQPPDTASQSGQAEGTSNSPGSRKICPFYTKGTCRHGLSGKGCPNEHPKPCKKLIQHGN